MSLRNTINRALDIAWNQLKDLAVVATLTKKSNGSFDFSTGEVSGVTSQNITLKVVLIEESAGKTESTNSTQTKCMFKMKDTSIIGNYDELLVGSTKYRISKPNIVNNSFIVTATLEKL